MFVQLTGFAYASSNNPLESSIEKKIQKRPYLTDLTPEWQRNPVKLKRAQNPGSSSQAVQPIIESNQAWTDPQLRPRGTSAPQPYQLKFTDLRPDWEKNGVQLNAVNLKKNAVREDLQTKSVSGVPSLDSQPTSGSLKRSKSADVFSFSGEKGIRRGMVPFAVNQLESMEGNLRETLVPRQTRYNEVRDDNLDASFERKLRQDLWIQFVEKMQKEEEEEIQKTLAHCNMEMKLSTHMARIKPLPEEEKLITRAATFAINDYILGYYPQVQETGKVSPFMILQEVFEKCAAGQDILDVFSKYFRTYSVYRKKHTDALEDGFVRPTNHNLQVDGRVLSERKE